MSSAETGEGLFIVPGGPDVLHVVSLSPTDDDDRGLILTMENTDQTIKKVHVFL